MENLFYSAFKKDGEVYVQVGNSPRNLKVFTKLGAIIYLVKGGMPLAKAMEDVKAVCKLLVKEEE